MSSIETNSTVNKNTIVSRVLLVDGILLLILAFIHLFSTPLISKWLSRELTAESLSNISPPFLLNHLVVGVLLIPFGISTMYSASGVRAGHPWARGIAITNALAVLILPLIVVVLMGPEYFNSKPFLAATVLITVIGLSMFLTLIWLAGKSKNT